MYEVKMTVVNSTAMIWLCILGAACLPWTLAVIAKMCGLQGRIHLTGITILFALAGWAGGLAFFSTP
jgi:hypothetical protein